MSADLQYSLGLDGSNFTSTAAAAEKTGLRLGGVLATLGAGAFAGGVLRRGMEFNKTMADGEAAIGKVIAQFQGLNDVAAKDEAAKAMQQIVALEPKAAGSLTTLMDGFLSTLAASQAAGLSVKENVDLVGRFANAMANANIPTEQLGQEMRSIVTANIGADSSLARILGITNEMVQQARDAGNLYGFLTEKIGKLGEAGDTAAVAFSSLESAVNQAAGALTKATFDHVVAGSKSLTEQLAEMTPQIERMGEGIGWLAEKSLDAFAAISDFGAALGVTAAAIGGMITDGLSYGQAMEQALDNYARLQQSKRETRDATDREVASNKALEQSAKAAAEAAKDKTKAETAPATPLADTRPAGRDEQGRGKIRGFSYAKSGANAGFTGLDEFSRLQQKEETKISDPARPGYARGAYVAKNAAFKTGAFKMPAEAAADALTAPDAAPRMRRRMMGGADAGALTDRAKAVLGAPKAPDDKKSQNPQDPTQNVLSAILGELQRIRTA